MEKELFDDLVQSLKQAKAISTGKAPASRRTVVAAPDVKVIREATGLSQTEFADLLKVSPRTLQNWEQQRRTPTGPAAVLLKIMQSAPDVVIRTLHSS